MIRAGIVRGVLAGEAMHPANLEHRVRLLSAKRFARMEVLHAFDRVHDETTPLRPYAHSSPPEVLQPGAGENTEWLVFSAVGAAGGSSVDDWIALASVEGVRARAGTRIALGNLSRGLRPPQSGHDNPHYFDDLAMVRALAAIDDPIAVAKDAHVTHDLEGVDCALAVAALFRALDEGETGDAAVARAVDRLPAGGWPHRLAVRALEVAGAPCSPLDRALRLGTEVADWIYSYPVAAPETLAVLLAHVAAATSAEDLLLGAMSTGRSGTTLAALVGAAAVARFGEDWIPEALTLEAPLPGIGVPAFAGRRIVDVLGGV